MKRALLLLMTVGLLAPAVPASAALPDLLEVIRPAKPKGPFVGLGTWVDLWDTALDPAEAVPAMRSRGVRTIYLQTARYNSSRALPQRDWVDAWLREAHARGVKVVGWYLPAYDEHLTKDVNRTVRIAEYRSPDGERFDALGVDIEYKGATETLDEFNVGISSHLKQVRARVGAYRIASIVPAPVAMARSPSSWTGFPWARIGEYSDVVMPMAYWSYRLADGSCASDPKYCAPEYGSENARRAANKTGLPVHIIGGIGDGVTTGQVRDFVDGSLDQAVIGGSMYDYRTTKSRFWVELARYNP